MQIEDLSILSWLEKKEIKLYQSEDYLRSWNSGSETNSPLNSK